MKKCDVEYINGIKHEIKGNNNDRKYIREFLLDLKKIKTNNNKIEKEEEQNKSILYYCISF